MRQEQYIILEHFTGTPTIITNIEGEVITFDSYDEAETFANGNIQIPQIISYELSN